jgi:predicted RNA-binding protein YlxR (DUF448 family)
MSNKASRAGHIAERTCVICREKKAQSELLPCKIRAGKVVIDLQRRLQGRSYYICDNNKCINGMAKWLKRQKRKR